MHDLSIYFESPFENIKVGKDKQFKFFEDHNSRLVQAVANGEPYAALLAATATAVENLKNSIGGQASTSAQQETKTSIVDNVIELFKTTIRKREAQVLVKFDKDNPVYLEFFPHGKGEYSHVTKASIEKLMSQFISAVSNHKTELGQPLLDEFIAIQASYVSARKEQLQKMEDTETYRTSWDGCIEAMKDQAFKNLLIIASENRNHPERIKKYFNQTIIRPPKYNKAGEEILPYTLNIAANTTQAAKISFSTDDSLEITNTSEISVFYYGAVTADTPCPAAAIELLPGESKIVTGEMLGAPINKYILFTNKDATSETEVEIIMLID